MKTNNQRLLEEQAKNMSTIDILNRLKEVKRIRDKADEEFYYLGIELWNRIPSVIENPTLSEREEEYQKVKRNNGRKTIKNN